jgi:hypothetical protein
MLSVEGTGQRETIVEKHQVAVVGCERDRVVLNEALENSRQVAERETFGD